MLHQIHQKRPFVLVFCLLALGVAVQVFEDYQEDQVAQRGSLYKDISPAERKELLFAPLRVRTSTLAQSRNPALGTLHQGHAQDWKAGDRPNVIGRWIAGEGQVGASPEETPVRSAGSSKEPGTAGKQNAGGAQDRQPFNFKKWDAAEKPRTDKIPVLVPLKDQLSDDSAQTLDDRQVVQWELGMEWRLGELGKQSDAELMNEDVELKREQKWLSLHKQDQGRLWFWIIAFILLFVIFVVLFCVCLRYCCGPRATEKQPPPDPSSGPVYRPGSQYRYSGPVLHATRPAGVGGQTAEMLDRHAHLRAASLDLLADAKRSTPAGAHRLLSADRDKAAAAQGGSKSHLALAKSHEQSGAGQPGCAGATTGEGPGQGGAGRLGDGKAAVTTAAVSGDQVPDKSSEQPLSDGQPPGGAAGATDARANGQEGGAGIRESPRESDTAESLYTHLQGQMMAHQRQRQPTSPKPPLPQPVSASSAMVAAAAAAAADGQAPPPPLQRNVASMMIQTSPRILESPRMDLSLAMTGSGLEWIFGSKWQMFAAGKGEGVVHLCLDGSLQCPSAGKHAHWWTDEQGRVNMEWGNSLGLHIMIMDKSRNKMTGVRVNGSVTVEALLISLGPEAQKRSAVSASTKPPPSLAESDSSVGAGTVGPEGISSDTDEEPPRTRGLQSEDTDASTARRLLPGACQRFELTLKQQGFTQRAVTRSSKPFSSRRLPLQPLESDLPRKLACIL